MAGPGRTLPIAVVLGALAFVACPGCAAPEVTRYLLHIDRSPGASETDGDGGAEIGRGAAPIIVEELRARRTIDGERIVYRPRPLELGRYETHRWAARPGAVVQEAVVHHLRRAGLAARVGPDDGPPGGPAYRVEGEIVHLEEVDEDTTWYGRVALRLRVIEETSAGTAGGPRGGRVVLRHDLDERAEAEQRRPGAVVRAMARALARGIEEFGRRLDDELAFGGHDRRRPG